MKSESGSLLCLNVVNVWLCITELHCGVVRTLVLLGCSGLRSVLRMTRSEQQSWSWLRQWAIFQQKARSLMCWVAAKPPKSLSQGWSASICGLGRSGAAWNQRTIEKGNLMQSAILVSSHYLELELCCWGVYYIRDYWRNFLQMKSVILLRIWI